MNGNKEITKEMLGEAITDVLTGDEIIAGIVRRDPMMTLVFTHFGAELGNVLFGEEE